MSNKTSHAAAATPRIPVIALARAANTPHDQLESLLANNPNPVVAISIAQRDDLDTRLVERLACDSRAAVRLRVAKNPLTPAHVLETLQNDPSAEVREAATEALLLKSMDEGFGNG